MKDYFFEHIRERRLFCVLMVVSTLGGLLYSYGYSKTHLIFFFAENRTQFWDLFFIYITKGSEWHGFLLFFLLLLAIHFGKALFLMVTALLSFVATTVFKWFFSSPRPAIKLDQINLLEVFNPVQDIAMHTGFTSFPSGHTLAAFAMCTYLVFVSRPFGFLGIAFFCLAWGIGFSRVYLGHHFFEDVMAGNIIGTIMGIFAWTLYMKFGSGFSGKFWRKVT